MLDTRTTMAAPAEYPYLVNKIAFFHFSYFCNETQIYPVNMQIAVMKYFLLVLAVPALMNSKCGKVKPDAVPGCILQKIEALKAEPKQNPAAEVNEYLYNGKRVFLFTSPCCDQYNILYDESCETMCAPTGGLTGKGDGKCADFNESAKHIKVIWKDER
jgi:hypothetical protein